MLNASNFYRPTTFLICGFFAVAGLARVSITDIETSRSHRPFEDQKVVTFESGYGPISTIEGEEGLTDSERGERRADVTPRESNEPETSDAEPVCEDSETTLKPWRPRKASEEATNRVRLLQRLHTIRTVRSAAKASIMHREGFRSGSLETLEGKTLSDQEFAERYGVERAIYEHYIEQDAKRFEHDSKGSAATAGRDPQEYEHESRRRQGPSW